MHGAASIFLLLAAMFVELLAHTVMSTSRYADLWTIVGILFAFFSVLTGIAAYLRSNLERSRRQLDFEQRLYRLREAGIRMHEECKNKK